MASFHGSGKEGDYEELYKVVIIGDSGVGKSNLLSRYSRDEFHVKSKATIGVEFQTQAVDVGDDSGRHVQVQIWDTAGQERFRAVTSAYYRGALGALIVYDVTRKLTFENTARWLEELRMHSNTTIVIMLVGNKSDLEEAREVSIGEGSTYAEAKGLIFMETSALNANNVSCAFEMVVREIHNQITHNSRPLSSASYSYYCKSELSNNKNGLTMVEDPNQNLCLAHKFSQCCYN
ncbi:hypothetical protein GOP47_0006177 [Adiantum capillus-veneris]|uniref:Uncharacterized protein n=1 Tax=Adiantum capillus-veneris TaxID=13818 RepID=A0A9D4ZMA3_ADICA|nr:hypothetical protein GOP47_0006177 [Adiantum capillus-veneris]